jgi:hypothetical protein
MPTPRAPAGPSMQQAIARGTAVLVRTGLGVNFVLPVEQPELESRDRIGSFRVIDHDEDRET